MINMAINGDTIVSCISNSKASGVDTVLNGCINSKGVGNGIMMVVIIREWLAVSNCSDINDDRNKNDNNGNN